MRQLKISLTDDLFRQLAMVSTAVGHSLASEIRRRLERTFAQEGSDPRTGVAGGDASGGVEGACCAGAASGDGVASEGAVGVACSVGGAAWARTSFAPAAASAM